MNKQNLNPWLGTKQEQNFGYWLGTQVRRLKQRPLWVKALYAFIWLAVAVLLTGVAVIIATVVLTTVAFLALLRAGKGTSSYSKINDEYHDEYHGVWVHGDLKPEGYEDGYYEDGVKICD